MKIYTKTGDGGETGLFGGERVPKDHVRLEAYGTADELSSILGLARALGLSEDVDTLIAEIQGDLFVIGAELATPDPKAEIPRLDPARTADLEAWIDKAEKRLPPLEHFILSGGDPEGAALHLARTVCRRLERRVAALGRETKLPAPIPVYLNRLSDTLFVAARLSNFEAGVEEIPWSPGKQGKRDKE